MAELMTVPVDAPLDKTFLYWQNHDNFPLFMTRFQSAVRMPAPSACGQLLRCNDQDGHTWRCLMRSSEDPLSVVWRTEAYPHGDHEVSLSFTPRGERFTTLSACFDAHGPATPLMSGLFKKDLKRFASMAAAGDLALPDWNGALSTDLGDEELEAVFERLAERWERETSFEPTISQMAMHPAHDEIVALGARTVPFILRRMRRVGGLWFAALAVLMGESPAQARQPISGISTAGT